MCLRGVKIVLMEIAEFEIVDQELASALQEANALEEELITSQREDEAFENHNAGYSAYLDAALELSRPERIKSPTRR